jgi:hypothetical protein
MSSSSGFRSSAAVTTLGSRAMPQRGQGPGSARTTSGCIGQVHSVGFSPPAFRVSPVLAAEVAFGRGSEGA